MLEIDVTDVELKSIMCRIPAEAPADVVQSLKVKKKTSDNFSAEILRLLTVAVRMESDPRVVSFPMPEELPVDVLSWVNKDGNREMLGRFVYAALTGLQGQLPVMAIQPGAEEEKKTNTAALNAMKNAAAMFLDDDE